MAVARLASGIELGYDATGVGETVLMIAGLGRDRHMWKSQAAELSRSFRVVTFDNRGVGDSSRPRGPYSAALMAEDASGLLDVLGVDKAFIVGASLGGLIAQELALSRPERVLGLALLCTHPGLPLAVPMSADVLSRIVPVPGADPYQRLLGAMRLAYGSAYWSANEAELSAAALQRFAGQPSPEMWWAQAAAGGTFGWNGRRIEAPALILTGDEDRIVPCRNSATLARMILDARLRIFPGGGHYFFQEFPDAVNAALIDFISAFTAANRT
jgi:pimeloyl-ACP methyl ester carboxylesterase